MKILVISDTHNRISDAYAVAQDVPDVTHILHLGDCISDAEELAKFLPHISVLMVRGNNDFLSDGMDERVLSLCGHTILMTHGHRYGVKTSLDRLAVRAKMIGADMVLFGHTHIKQDEKLDGITFLNPSARGYIIINEDGTYEFQYYE